jgi:hypothetical protein
MPTELVLCANSSRRVSLEMLVASVADRIVPSFSFHRYHLLPGLFFFISLSSFFLLPLMLLSSLAIA